MCRFSKLLIAIGCAGMITLLAQGAHAQMPAKLYAYWGYGKYGMGEMKSFQQSSIEGLPVNARATDQFPAHFLYGLKFAFHSPVEDRYGIVAEVGSTGGRIAYADYSGSYLFDQLLRYKRLGVVLERYHPLPKGFVGWLGIEISGVRSTLVFEEEVQIYQVGSSTDSYTFHAWGGSVQPTATLEKSLYGLKVGLQAGACLNFNEGFRLKGNRDAKLINVQKEGREVGPSWSGFRIGLLVGVPLGK